MKPCLYLSFLILIITGCNKSADQLRSKIDSLTHQKPTEPNNPVDTNKPVKPDTGWFAIAPLPGPRTYATGFALGNKGYVCSGVIDLSDPHEPGYDDMLMYDPAKNSWTQKAGLPKLLYPNMGRHQPFSFVINNKAYAGGGLSIDGIGGQDIQEYDPVVDTWIPRAKLDPGVQFSESTATVCAGNAYIASYTTSPKALYIFDPTDNTVKKTYIFRINDNLQSDGWLASDDISLFYGYSGGPLIFLGNKPGSQEYSFFGSDSSTIPIKPAPVQQGIFYKNSLYISFGDAGNLYRYNFTLKKWQALSLRKLGVTAGISTFLLGSKLYIIGGNNGVFSPSTNKAWAIDLDAYPEI